MLIKQATIKDVEIIRSFINDKWKENHIVSRDKSFFNYQHKINNKINFIVAKNNKELIGILGYIPSSTDRVTDVFTVIWKVLDNQNPLLGIQMLKFLEKKKDVRYVFSNGINPKTFGLYKYLGFYINKLDHYVMINDNLKKFNIAELSHLNFNSTFNSNKNIKHKISILGNVNELDNFNFGDSSNHIPYRNREYFIRRYLKHPVFKYSIYLIFKYDKLVSIYVTRIQKKNSSKIIRIIDFYGDQNTLGCFSNYIYNLLLKYSYEYVDFYCFGMNHEKLISSGFNLVNHESNDVIIPEYFYPFEKKNIDIYFFSNTKQINEIKIFKGDGDMDRPS